MPPSSATGLVILALETATTCGSLALVAEDRCLAEYSLTSSITHSRSLLTGIHWLLAQCDLSWPQIRAIAVSLGPGSFTGLRIALSTAKGLCNPQGIPEKTTEPMVIKPERLPEFITTPTLLVGDGLPLYGQMLKELLVDLALLAPTEICFARAAAIGSAAWHLFRQGAFLDPATAVPIYVRASDAELQFGEKKRIKS